MGPPTSAAAERRAHPRIPAAATVHCRRLGRSGFDRDVRVVDVSMGGVRIAAPDPLHVGDLVTLSFSEDASPLTVRGLVVGTTPHEAGAAFGHIAFTSLGPAGLEGVGRLVDALQAH